jgi:hypothetical protein
MTATINSGGYDKATQNRRSTDIEGSNWPLRGLAEVMEKSKRARGILNLESELLWEGWSKDLPTFVFLYPDSINSKEMCKMITNHWVLRSSSYLDFWRTLIAHETSLFIHLHLNSVKLISGKLVWLIERRPSWKVFIRISIRNGNLSNWPY